MAVTANRGHRWVLLGRRHPVLPGESSIRFAPSRRRHQSRLRYPPTLEHTAGTSSRPNALRSTDCQCHRRRMNPIAGRYRARQSHRQRNCARPCRGRCRIVRRCARTSCGGCARTAGGTGRPVAVPVVGASRGRRTDTGRRDPGLLRCPRTWSGVRPAGRPPPLSVCRLSARASRRHREGADACQAHRLSRSAASASTTATG
ncbi:hypothetical protein D3C78_474600 [compost metagenome]